MPGAIASGDLLIQILPNKKSLETNSGGFFLQNKRFTELNSRWRIQYRPGPA